MADSIFRVENLSLGFKVKHKVLNVLDDISFAVEKGKFLGIVGESGCGKSLTAMTIMRLLPPAAVVTSGSVQYKNRNLLELSDSELLSVRGKEIAMIFQEPMTSLNPVHRIGDQIAEMLELHGNMSVEERESRCIEMLHAVNIPSPEKVLKQYPHELSGGMRQRAMIAMAMACDQMLLLADEPTTALDVTIQAQILQIMRKLKDQFDSSIIMITHNLGVIHETCDDVIVMYAGQIVEKAPVAELFKNPMHPYTVGLLECIVDVNAKKGRLPVIPGMVPSPEDFPAGCRFSPRCSHVCGGCNEKQPLIQVSDNHYVRCGSIN